MQVFIWLIVIAFIAGVIAFFVKVLSHSTKEIIKQSEDKGRFNASITSNMKHVNGLPIAKGMMTTVYYCPTKLVFVAGEQEFTLDKSRIQSISTATGSDISSKVTGAAAGALIFGGLTGAVVGSLMGATLYFIVVYEKNGEIKSILLDTDMSIHNANRIKDKFNSEKGIESKQIEL